MKSSSANLGSVLSKVLIVVAILIAVVFGKSIGEKTTGLFSQFVATVKNLGAYPESAWSKRTVGEVTLDAPFAFEPGQDIRDQLPPETRKALLSFDTQSSEKSARFFQATVVRLECVSGIDPSLDGAAEGAIKEVAAKVGDAEPKFTVTPTTLDELEARQSTYHSTTAKGSLYVDGIFVKKGQVMWQVSVFYESESSKPSVQRLLQSVHVNAAP